MDFYDETVIRINSKLINEKINLSPYGLCAECELFSFQQSTLKDIVVWCESGLKLRPNNVDPVVMCSHFARKNQMSLRDMKTIAWRINIEEKNPIGFQPTTEKKVTIEKPKTDVDIL